MRRFRLLIAAAVVLACACSREDGLRVSRVSTPDSGKEIPASVFLPGQISVYFDEELVSIVESGDGLRGMSSGSSGLAAAMEELGVVSLERVFPEDPEFEDRHREFGLHRWYRVRFDGGTPSPSAAERFALVPGVLNSRPVNKVSMADEAFFDDPMENRQWHYHNPSVSWADVNVLPVWKNYTRGSSKVIVSVVDGGIDLSHEDLADAVVAPGDNGSKSFMSSGSAYRITGTEHGTHVAGTIGAVNNNGKGVAGIAGGDARKGEKGVRLMSCQVFSDTSNDGANFEAALVWGADHGAVISNNSWGHKYTDDKGNYNKEAAEYDHNFFQQPNSGAYKDGMKDAIDYFNKYAGMSKSGQQTGPMAGGLVVFAAGNDGRPYGAPAGYPGCLAVGAITSYGTRSNFSNYGSWVDICAPGVGVLSTIPDNQYELLSGTSMACPHVSGVAALVVSYCGGIGFTREMLWEKMTGGANSADVPASYRIGPLADALGAICYGTGEPPAKVETVAVDEVLSNNVTISLTVPADHDGMPAYGFRVLAAERLEDLMACDPRSPEAPVVFGDFLSRDAEVGATVTGTVGDLGFNKTYYVAVSSFDYGRNFSAISGIKTIVTGGNHAPVISTSYTGDFKFHVHERFTIPFTIIDEDRHVVNVQFDKDENDTGVLNLLESTGNDEYVLQVVGTASKEGKYHGVLRAADNYGLTAEYAIDYEVLPNEAPVVLKQVDNIVFGGVGETARIDMLEYIVDPDGEILNYVIDISDNSVVHVNQSTGSAVLTVTALSGSGLSTVTLSATDAGGKKVSASFKVLVRPEGQMWQYYPNPVIDTLHVGTGFETGAATISLYNSIGAKVYSATFNCSAFDPAEIDMASAAPGLYTLRTEYGGKVYSGMLIKR